MNKRILRLAIPNILSNLSIPLLSSVDTAVVGHFDDIYYLGAIAVGSMLFNFIYWGFGFLRMGTTGLTAQAFGKNDKNEISIIFYRAILIAVIAGLGLILLRNIISGFGFSIINASDEVDIHARSYFAIRIFAAPATLTLYVFHGWFLGMQNAKAPLLLTVLVNVLNIVFNLLFVYRFGMMSDGVALGTVISQYIGLTAAVVVYYKLYSGYAIKIKLNNLLDKIALKKYFAINFDIFIRTLLLVFVFSFFTTISAEYGNTTLAANTILLQLWTIMAYGIDGFAFAAESLVGKYIGASDSNNLKLSIRYSFYWGSGLGLIISVVYFIFDKQLISLFTSDQTVIAYSLSLFIWTAIAPFLNSFGYIWDGIYIGATATKTMRNAMIFCAFVLFLPIFYLTEQFYGNNALWLSITLFMIARGISLSIFAPGSIKIL